MPVEFIVGAAVGVAAASRPIRNAFRKGLIYTVGGVLVAYDKVAAMAHGVRRTVHEATASPPKAAAPNSATPLAAPEASPANVSVNPPAPAGTPS
jgi:hypothetical protein